MERRASDGMAGAACRGGRVMRRRAKVVAKTAKNMRNKNHRVALARIIASLRRLNPFYL
jgi:hypothetical protein